VIPLRETLATLGFILFFIGAMLALSGSSFVTHGGISPATYFRVGVIQVIGTVVIIAGMYLIIKTR
jgi:hypothetical protein